MERSLLSIALAMGCGGWVCSLLLSRVRSNGMMGQNVRTLRPYLLTALALPLLGYLATLPSKTPFAAGQGWGQGFLIGGWGAALAAFVALCAVGEDDFDLNATRATSAIVAPFSMGLAVTALPLLWIRHSLLDTLLGVAIGWLVVTFVVAQGVSVRDRGRLTALLPLAAGVGFVATLCAVASLGEMRSPIALASTYHTISWSALALALATGVPFTLLICGLPTPVLGQAALKLPLAGLVARLFGRLFHSEDARQIVARGLRVLFGALLLIGLGKLLSVRVVRVPQLFTLTLLGIGGALLAWWVMAGRLRQERENDAGVATGWQNGALAILVVLAGTMAAYPLQTASGVVLAGFGVGFLLIAAWLVVGLALVSALEPDSRGKLPEDIALHTGSHLIRLALFGVILLLYRLFQSRYSDLARGISLSDQYALFGFLVGAMTPALLSGFLLRPVEAAPVSPAGQIVRLVLVGALTLVLPAFLLLLWGAKCALALLFGLALAIAITETGRKEAGETGKSPLPSLALSALLPALFSLAIALALSQWTQHVLAYALLSRAEKTRILLWAVSGMMTLIVLGDYGGRIGAAFRKGRGGLSAGANEKGTSR